MTPPPEPPALFKVVLSGKCLPGFSEAVVLPRVQQALRLDAERAAALLGQPGKVLKRGLTEADARRYAEHIRALGLAADVMAEPPPASSPGPVQGLLELQQKLPRPATRPLYTLSLLTVALLCLLIPLAYLALTASIGLGLWHYETAVAPALRIHNIYLLTLVFAVPLFAGGIVMLFLLKAFVGSTSSPPAQYRLDPSVEPEFVAGIQALCRTIGVRPPQEIQLSYQVNASVHFRYRWFGLLTGSKVLTIGLPLAAGLNARQLVAVLAHEFGHFAQGVGMRCIFIINTVNRWLESRAYHEDEWDQHLRELQQDSNHLLGQLIAALAQLGLGLTRLLLRLLFQLSLRMSRSLSRHMEYDADRYAALVAGSEAFREMSLRVLALGRAFAEADRRNASAFGAGQLLADLPGAVAEHMQGFQPQDWDQLRGELYRQRQTRYWDTHPADTARIDNAEALGAPGIFLDERPASALFRNFPALCRQVTQRYYSLLGISYQTGQLVESKAVLRRHEVEDAHADTLKRYFNGMFQPQPWLPLQAAGDSPELLALGWQASIDELRRLVPEASKHWQALGGLSARRRQLALTLCLNGLQIPTPRERDSAGRPRDLLSLRDEYEALLAGRLPEDALLTRVFGLCRRRLACALAALPDTQQQEAAELSRVISVLVAQAPLIAEIEDCQLTLRAIGQLPVPEMTTGVPREQQRLGLLHEKLLNRLLRALRPVPATLLFKTSLGAWLESRCPRLQTADALATLAEAASPLPAACQHAYELAMAELVARAGQAEKAAGIRPIKLVTVARSSA